VRKNMFYSCRSFVIFAALPLLWGCVGGGASSPLHHFLLDYPPPAVQKQDCSHQTVKILEFASAHAYNTPSMVYASAPFRKDAYLYSRWRVSPGRMVSDYLVRDVRKAGIFGAAFTSRDEESTRFLVEGIVDEFYESDEGDPKAVLAVTVTLMDMQEKELPKRMLFQRGYRVVEPMTQKSAEALAQAMSLSVARFSERLLADICSAVKGR
jgi:ABC-type uncharacterized transport system auxiliary subunit